MAAIDKRTGVTPYGFPMAQQKSYGHNRSALRAHPNRATTRVAPTIDLLVGAPLWLPKACAKLVVFAYSDRLLEGIKKLSRRVG